jgi:hypothetical protein
MGRGVGVAVLVFGLWTGAASVEAKATWVKKAQAVDPSIKDCLSCHTTKKGRELNAGRGQFLMDRKKELGLKDVDLQWLKDYKEPEAASPAPSVEPSEATAAPTAAPPSQ